NVIEADPATFKPGDGSLIVASDAAEVGWAYANGEFTPVAPLATNETSGLTFLQFMALFTSIEQVGIANTTDTQARLFVMMATGAGSIDLTNPEVVGGVNYLASINLISPSRVATILSGAQPA